MSSKPQLICEFSPSGDLFAIATADGRVKAFDTGNGQLRCSTQAKAGEGAGGHLVDRVNCICWVATGKSAKKAKVVSVAVGNTAGLVRLLNTQTGEIVWAQAGVHDGGVNSVASVITPEGSVVLSSGQDGQLCLLDAQTGAVRTRAQPSKHPCSCVRAARGGQHVVVAGSNVLVWDPVKLERLATFSGHPTPARTACFSPDGSYALTASGSERQVAIWKVGSSSSAADNEPRKKKKSKSACGSLSMSEPALSLDTCAGRNEDEFMVAAVTEAGSAYVWRVDTANQDGVSCELLANFSIQPTPGSNDAEHVLGVKLEGCSSGTLSVLLARGSRAKPTFQRLSVDPSPPPGKPAARNVTLQPTSVGGLILEGTGGQKKATAAKATKDVTVLGVDNAGDAVARATVAKQKAETGKKRALGDADGDHDMMNGLAHGEDMDTDEEGDDDDEDVGQTLEERVAALEAQTRSEAPQQQTAVASSSGAILQDDKLRLLGPNASDRADSLSVLLTQAVRSGDKSLLERCLEVREERVVKNTVARLVAMDAAQLLSACVERLQTKAVRGSQLAVWIRALLLRHTAFFMSAPSVQPTLTTLYQIIEQRLSMHRTLVSLAGRLDLVLAQLPPSSKSKAGEKTEGEGAKGRTGPLVIYESDDEGVATEEVGALQAGLAGLEDDDEDEEEDDDDDASSWEEASGDEEDDDGDLGNGDLDDEDEDDGL